MKRPSRVRIARTWERPLARWVFKVIELVQRYNLSDHWHRELLLLARDMGVRGQELEDFAILFASKPREPSPPFIDIEPFVSQHMKVFQKWLRPCGAGARSPDPEQAPRAAPSGHRADRGGA